MAMPIATRRFRRRELRGVIFSLEDPTITEKKKRQLSVHVSDMYGHLTVHIRKFLNGRPTKEGVAFNYAAWLELMNQMAQIDLAVHSSNNSTTLTIDKIRNLTVEDGGSEKVRIKFKREDNCTQVEVCLKRWQRFIELCPDISAAIEKHRTQCNAELEAKKFRQSIANSDYVNSCANTTLTLASYSRDPCVQLGINNNFTSTVVPPNSMCTPSSNSYNTNNVIAVASRPMSDAGFPSVQLSAHSDYLFSRLSNGTPNSLHTFSASNSYYTNSMFTATNRLMQDTRPSIAQLYNNSDCDIIYESSSLPKARFHSAQLRDSADYIRGTTGNATSMPPYRITPSAHMEINPSGSQWDFNIARIKQEPIATVPWFTNLDTSGSQVYGISDYSGNHGLPSNAASFATVTSATESQRNALDQQGNTMVNNTERNYPASQLSGSIDWSSHNYNVLQSLLYDKKTSNLQNSCMLQKSGSLYANPTKNSSNNLGIAYNNILESPLFMNKEFNAQLDHERYRQSILGTSIKDLPPHQCANSECASCCNSFLRTLQNDTNMPNLQQSITGSSHTTVNNFDTLQGDSRYWDSNCDSTLTTASSTQVKNLETQCDDKSDWLENLFEPIHSVKKESNSLDTCEVRQQIGMIVDNSIKDNNMHQSVSSPSCNNNDNVFGSLQHIKKESVSIESSEIVQDTMALNSIKEPEIQQDINNVCCTNYDSLSTPVLPVRNENNSLDNYAISLEDTVATNGSKNSVIQQRLNSDSNSPSRPVLSVKKELNIQTNCKQHDNRESSPDGKEFESPESTVNNVSVLYVIHKHMHEIKML